MSRYALLLATERHTDPAFTQLVSPRKDVATLYEALTATDIGGFTADSPLVDRPHQELRIRIEQFFRERSKTDLLLLYFSGHGVLDDRGRLYLAATDTRRNTLRSTAIEAAFIRDLMDECRAQCQILILDCCHSGAFERAKGVIGASVGTAGAFEGNGLGRIVLTASDATQYAFDGNLAPGEISCSVFTHFLADGLRTGAADVDGNGLVTIDELYSA